MPLRILKCEFHVAKRQKTKLKVMSKMWSVWVKFLINFGDPLMWWLFHMTWY